MTYSDAILDQACRVIFKFHLDFVGRPADFSLSVLDPCFVLCHQWKVLRCRNSVVGSQDSLILGDIPSRSHNLLERPAIRYKRECRARLR